MVRNGYFRYFENVNIVVYGSISLEKNLSFQAIFIVKIRVIIFMVSPIIVLIKDKVE